MKDAMRRVRALFKRLLGRVSYELLIVMKREYFNFTATKAHGSVIWLQYYNFLVKFT